MGTRCVVHTWRLLRTPVVLVYFLCLSGLSLWLGHFPSQKWYIMHTSCVENSGVVLRTQRLCLLQHFYQNIPRYMKNYPMISHTMNIPFNTWIQLALVSVNTYIFHNTSSFLHMTDLAVKLWKFHSDYISLSHVKGKVKYSLQIQ